MAYARPLRYCLTTKTKTRKNIETQSPVLLGEQGQITYGKSEKTTMHRKGTERVVTVVVPIKRVFTWDEINYHRKGQKMLG